MAAKTGTAMLVVPKILRPPAPDNGQTSIDAFNESMRGR